MILSERFEDALVTATRLHSRQLRKGTEIPYVSHLLGVASIALEHGANEDEAIAALLHDAVEDQGGLPTLELIRNKFGDTVADIVHGCTDAEVFPKPPWRERKEAYLAHLNTASPSILLVSISDKLHNARTILAGLRLTGDEIWERFKGGKTGTMWYYRSLVSTFKKVEVPPGLLGELEKVISELEQLAFANVAD